jgi:hypothetical protein
MLMQGFKALKGLIPLRSHVIETASRLIGIFDWRTSREKISGIGMRSCNVGVKMVLTEVKVTRAKDILHTK